MEETYYEMDLPVKYPPALLCTQHYELPLSLAPG